MNETQQNSGELRSIAVGEHRFCYRVGPAGSGVYFWNDTGNYDEPFLETRLIARAASKIRKVTGIDRVLFSAAPAPEHFDHTADDDRVACFNQRVIDALIALGAPDDYAYQLFDYVGMPSEWRGAMWRAATMAEALPTPTEAHINLTQRIATVCRFMPITMAVDGSFKWSLAVGNQVLLDAIVKFTEALRFQAPGDE